MMKRHCCMLCAILLVMIALLTVLPVYAQEDLAYATLDYVMDPAPGEETGKSAHVFDKIEFERAVTVTWHTDTANLLLDGEPVEGESLRLEKAGRYRLTVQKKNAPASKDYTVFVLPTINIFPEQSFTSYPTIECENALTMNLDLATVNQIKDLPSGTEVRGLGAHTLQVVGENGQKWDYKFYIKVCTATTVFNESLGKFALKLDVGSFDDLQTVVTLDGKRELSAGENYETRVGTHTIAATVNGAPVSNLYAIPSAEDLFLRVDFMLPETELKSPITLRLSLYDGDFYYIPDYVDGESYGAGDMVRIDGDFRLERNGTQAVLALNEAGEEIEYLFRVTVSEDDKGTTMTRVVLDFQNPHRIYALLAIPLAAVMLGTVAWFFVKRRRIV